MFVFYPSPSTITATEDTPWTIYHQGVVILPVDDSYATTPINTVVDNIDEGGNVDLNATTVTVNQKRLANGQTFSTLDGRTEMPSGFVYLGTYTDIVRVVVTGDGTTGTVVADTVVLRAATEPPRSTSTTRTFYANYTLGESVAYSSTDFEAGVSVVNLLDKTQLDAYSDRTSPSIIDDDINDMNVAT